MGDAVRAKEGVHRCAIEPAIAQLIDHDFAGRWWRQAAFPHDASKRCNLG
ncbi:MAG: hypothetical protein KGL42_11015 [Betaproteobacteria bacterium]|nr:hypothetical protein [Betaproteobacteria bacterium]